MAGNIYVQEHVLEEAAKELKNVANQINARGESVDKLITNCSAELKVSGLDLTTVNTAFKSVYTGLEDSLQKLVDYLNNSAIVEYNRLQNEIVKSFESIGSELQRIVNVINK